MTFRIHNGFDDSFDITCDNDISIEDLRATVRDETTKRGWDDVNCWSEKISD